MKSHKRTQTLQRMRESGVPRPESAAYSRPQDLNLVAGHHQPALCRSSGILVIHAEVVAPGEAVSWEQLESVSKEGRKEGSQCQTCQNKLMDPLGNVG